MGHVQKCPSKGHPFQGLALPFSRQHGGVRQLPFSSLRMQGCTATSFQKGFVPEPEHVHAHPHLSLFIGHAMHLFFTGLFNESDHACLGCAFEHREGTLATLWQTQGAPRKSHHSLRRLMQQRHCPLGRKIVSIEHGHREALPLRMGLEATLHRICRPQGLVGALRKGLIHKVQSQPFGHPWLELVGHDLVFARPHNAHVIHAFVQKPFEQKGQKRPARSLHRQHRLGPLGQDRAFLFTPVFVHQFRGLFHAAGTACSQHHGWIRGAVPRRAMGPLSDGQRPRRTGTCIPERLVHFSRGVFRTPHEGTTSASRPHNLPSPSARFHGSLAQRFQSERAQAQPITQG